jgi:hypothetical protein
MRQGHVSAKPLVFIPLHSPTTDQQLSPVYAAIFQAASGDVAGAAIWLAQWKPVAAKIEI